MERNQETCRMGAELANDTAVTRSQDGHHESSGFRGTITVLLLLIIIYYGLIFWKMFIVYSSILFIPELKKEKQSFKYVIIKAIK